jgi:hypothetical protein
VTNSITPPNELVQQWLCSDDYQWGPLEQTSITITTNRLNNVATQAAQWGADQELEACCKAINDVPGGWADSRHLRHVRRPKPPSLKEQALASLDKLESPGRCDEPGYESICNTIRRALEQL